LLPVQQGPQGPMLLQGTTRTCSPSGPADFWGQLQPLGLTSPGFKDGKPAVSIELKWSGVLTGRVTKPTWDLAGG
jgi:hypothetical protein